MKTNWEKLLIQALVAFFGSHLDELVIFVAQFARVVSYSKQNIQDQNETTPLMAPDQTPLRTYHVITGQILAFTLTLGLSFLGYFLGVYVDREWIGLLGFIPILLGLKELIGEILKFCKKRKKKKEGEGEKQVDFEKFEKKAAQEKWIHNASHIVQVAIVGFASGTDSIGVFVPLFASTSWFPCVVFVVLFYILFILWLGLAYALVNQKNIAVAIKRYGEYIGSVLLIALGVYVIIDCGTYKLIKKI